MGLPPSRLGKTTNMVDTSGPVTPRRRLAAALRHLREEADLRLEQVADHLLISRSKLSRLENAQGRPHPRDVRDLIRFYGLDGTPQAAEMIEWLEAARSAPWWDKYRRVAGFDAQVAYESEAAAMRLYAIPVLPVLLQTPDYLREYCRAAGCTGTAEQVEELVELRLRRQQALTDRTPPLDLTVVVHESCLRQVVGSPAVMRAQLDALAERSTAANIELRVLPFTAPPAFAMGCTYAYFSFEGVDQDIVSVECHAGLRLLDNPRQLADYDRHFRDLQGRSLTPAASRDLLRTVARSFTASI